METLRTDGRKQLKMQFLFFCRFLQFCPVFVNVHIFICVPEQFPKGTSLKIFRSGISGCIADRHIWMETGIVCTQLFQLKKKSMESTAFCIFYNGNKFITAISSCKLVIRDRLIQLVSKGTDIGVSHFMSHGIVDDTKVI